MKRAILFLAISVTFSAFSSNLLANPNNEYFRTIILINGTPFLVELDSEGDVIQNFALVPNYFESSDSHDAIVSRVSDEYEEEIAGLMNSRLIIFNEERALLNDIAVDHIRELATLYAKGYLHNINITAGHSDDYDDEALAAYRIDAIFQLLKDFGVQEGDISADMKIYKSELPNQFVKIDLLK